MVPPLHLRLTLCALGVGRNRCLTPASDAGVCGIARTNVGRLTGGYIRANATKGRGAWDVTVATRRYGATGATKWHTVAGNARIKIVTVTEHDATADGSKVRLVQVETVPCRREYKVCVGMASWGAKQGSRRSNSDHFAIIDRAHRGQSQARHLMRLRRMTLNPVTKMHWFRWSQTSDAQTL